MAATPPLAGRPLRSRTATFQRSTLPASTPNRAAAWSMPCTRSIINTIGSGSRPRKARNCVMCSTGCAWSGRPVARSVA